MKLSGKTAIITGSAKRLGRSLALRLAREGVSPTLHYKDSEAEALETAKLCGMASVNVNLCRADLRERKSAGEIVESHLKAFGGIDLLILNASLFFPTPEWEDMEKSWDDFFNVHLHSSRRLCALAAGELKKNKGRILIMGDIYAQRPLSKHLPYSTSKAALSGLCAGLARDLAPEVLVNALAPGAILFPPSMPDEAKRKVLSNIPLGRTGREEEIAAAASFLLQQDYMTGQTLAVDGGRSIVF